MKDLAEVRSRNYGAGEVFELFVAGLHMKTLRVKWQLDEEAEKINEAHGSER